MDRHGRPLPWLTYPALSFIAARVRPELTVFEYGAGNSTLWWSARVRRVIVCEHEATWYNWLQSRAPSNIEARLVELTRGGTYCRASSDYRGEFDVLVIDGRDRVNCAIQGEPALHPHGVVIWDNAERLEYAPGLTHLASCGFRRIDFDGPGPINPYAWRTSVLYRPGNCFGI